MANFLTIILSLFVGIYVILSVKLGRNEFTDNCLKNNTGIFNNFLILDDLFGEIDSIFCTNNCPCKFDNVNAINSIDSEGAKWVSEDIKNNKKLILSNNESGAKNFRECNLSFIYQAEKNFKLKHPIDKTFKKFDMMSFMNYFKKIENKFECNGWCNPIYKNKNDENNYIKLMYYFSDVNKGIPKTKGCMKKLVEWLPKYLKAIGSFFIIIAAMLIFVLILSIFLLCGCTEDDDKNKNNGNCRYSLRCLCFKKQIKKRNIGEIPKNEHNKNEIDNNPNENDHNTYSNVKISNNCSDKNGEPYSSHSGKSLEFFPSNF